MPSLEKSTCTARQREDSMLNLPYIKSRREALDLSLADAARLAGWGVKARTRWHDIESGRAPNPTLRTLLDMCKVLECNLNQLVV